MQDKNSVNYKDSFELKLKLISMIFAATTEVMISQESILKSTMFCNCCLLEMHDKNNTRNSRQE